MKKPIFVNNETALSWANKHFPFSEHRIIRELPWSKVIELIGTSEISYLKLTQDIQKHTLKTNTILTQYFTSELPEIIAINDEFNSQLIRAHGGIELGSNPSKVQIQKMLTSYATMQAQSKDFPEVISSIPSLNLENLVTNFLEFLKPKKNTDKTKVCADFFLGSKDSKEYSDVFLERKQILEDFLQNAALLSPTLNHGDLRSEYVAERNDGASIINDWDHACIGPAGLSLHAVFGNCFKIAQLLTSEITEDQNDEFDLEKRLLQHYIEELDKQKYASKEILQHALPATACAGVIQSVLRYADFPLEDDNYLFNVSEYFERQFFDLLNLCDYLSCSTRDKMLYFANDYLERDIKFRAVIIYRQYLKTHPNDFEIYKKLAVTLNQSGKWEEAISCFNYIIEHDPSNVETYNELGVTLLENNHSTEAIQKFEQALSIAPDYREAQINRDKATELLNMMGLAQHPNILPTVQISSEERVLGKYNVEKTNTAYNLFKEYGALVAENVFDPKLLQSINKQILGKYDSYLEPRKDGRDHRVTLNIEGSLNSPDLYDNPFIKEITQKILGDDFILGSVSMRGAISGEGNQTIHKEHSALFCEDDEFRENTPCFAFSVLIPLVHPVDTTLVVKKSHKTTINKAQNMPEQSPLINIGSCLMLDYRVANQDLANYSSNVNSPLLILIYHRSWFRDCFNFKQQVPIIIDDEIFNTSPERMKELISWAKP